MPQTILPILNYKISNNPDDDFKFFRYPEEQEPGLNFNDGEFMPCFITVDNEFEAIEKFLDNHKKVKTSFQTYCKEVERFLLWLESKSLPITAVKEEHWKKYLLFLAKPNGKKWICSGKPAKFKPDGSLNKKWRPFSGGGLSEPSIKKSGRIIKSLFKYLSDQNYLHGNPLLAASVNSNINDQDDDVKDRVKERILRNYVVSFVINVLDKDIENIPETEIDKALIRSRYRAIRAKYIILLLYETGMRISELSNHSSKNVTRGTGNNSVGDKFFSIKGKGSKSRSILLFPKTYQSYWDYMSLLGADKLIDDDKEIPLIPSMNLKSAISTRHISTIVKGAFLKAHNIVENRLIHIADPAIKSEISHDSKQLKLATAHWLRHSHASHYLDDDHTLPEVMERFGHSNVETAMIYQHDKQKSEMTKEKEQLLRNIINEYQKMVVDYSPTFK